jgi:hypothetical protein
MGGRLYLCEHSLYDILLDIQTSGGRGTWTQICTKITIGPESGSKKEADKRKKEGSEIRESKVGHNDGK